MFLTFVRLLLARPGEFETEKKLKASVKASVAEGGIHIAEIGAGQVKKKPGWIQCSTVKAAYGNLTSFLSFQNIL